MSDDERIQQLELEVKVLRDNNKGLKDKIDEQSKEIEELKEVKWYYEISRVPKDKIKAKIEEWDDKDLTICYGGRSQGRTFQQAVRTEVKNILQSLLEKE